MANPKYFRFPFAATGDKETVPDDAQSSGALSYAEGFGLDYERDPTTDAKAKRMPRDGTNQVLYDATSNIQQYQLHGVPYWYDASSNGGTAIEYKKNAIVRYSDGTSENVYISLKDNNTDTPTVDTSWFLFAPYDATLLSRLSVAPFVPVESMTLTTPPATPTKGKLYLVPANATDAWANKNGQIAEWNGKSWAFAATQEGHTIGLSDGRLFTKVNGAYIEKLALDTQSGKWLYAEASGSANALTATLTPAPTALPKQIIILPKYDNTDAATLILNGFSQRSILSQNGSALVAGDLKAGTPALLALMANGNYTLTNAASAPPPGTGFAGSKTFFSWKPNTAATSNLEASFIAPCVGIIMAFSTANKSYNSSDGAITNVVTINNNAGNGDRVTASSMSTSILLVEKGTSCKVKSSVTVDKAIEYPVSQYLNYVFIPA